ncbi:transporter substrate-binding domain-containing protein [Streptococcus oricebi]|uniref:Amino acid ABC transporter substrate-binding protein n=1 Tax=Streptococcus oricebi TaxID=1547447 RepID=A0ABS5B0L4_9STRE|nr:transporter substrate-binding domain-containing protein [Streptococcus oricebi]MBP2622377.1 amino acid ABC transporter substrate-binding protein [Streptococcus oricebi]
MKLKTIVLSSLALILSLSLFACASKKEGASVLENIKSRGKLVVATCPNYAPFEFQTLVDGKNKVVGADIELAQAIADEIGVDLELSSMSFDNVLSSLQSGRSDLALASLSVTEERQKVFDFSEPYYETQNSILIKQKEQENYHQFSDFAGKKIAVLKGSIQEGLAKQQLKEAQVTPLPATGEAVNELKAGKVDAVYMEGPVAAGFVAQNKDLAQAQVQLPASDGASLAIALKKEEQDLKAVVDKVVRRVKAKGDYDKYIQKSIQLTAVSE